jgi:hypothetical protein
MTLRCPLCGKPLVKENNKYCCQSEQCPVVFVRHPDNPFKKKVFYVSTVKKAMMRKVEEATAREINSHRLAKFANA